MPQAVSLVVEPWIGKMVFFSRPAKGTRIEHETKRGGLRKQLKVHVYIWNRNEIVYNNDRFHMVTLVVKKT